MFSRSVAAFPARSARLETLFLMFSEVSRQVSRLDAQKKNFQTRGTRGGSSNRSGNHLWKIVFLFFLIVEKYFHDFSSFQGLLEKVQFRMAERPGNASKRCFQTRATREDCSNRLRKDFCKNDFLKKMIENLDFYDFSSISGSSDLLTLGA